MLKKTVAVITVLLLCCAFALIVHGEGCMIAREQDLMLGNLKSLDSAEVLALKQERKASDRAFLSLSYGGFDLPVYDEASGTSLFCKQMSNQITVGKNISCEIGSIADESGVTILAYDRVSFRTYRVEWTTLPIICLQPVGLPLAKSIDRDLHRGIVTTFDSETGEARQRMALLRTRGNSSMQYPKAAYLMKFVDLKTGGEESASLLGLSENTEYALNSLYEDGTKIRDFASLSLWNAIRGDARDTARLYAIDFVYAEVFVGGIYAGLYGFQESTNLASFGLANTGNISLFNPDSHRIPQMETLPASGEEWDEINLEETTQEKPWTFLGSALENMFYREGDDFQSELFQSFDRDSFVDYTIWCNLLYASDNLWKNMLLLADQRNPANGKIFPVPWDSDQSFGLIWDGSMPLQVYEDAARADQPLPEAGPLPLGKIWEYDVDGFRHEVAARWFSLRQGLLREDVLLASLDAAFERVTQSGARERDALRWPQSPVYMDNSFIESFMRRRLAYLDEYYAVYR